MIVVTDGDETAWQAIVAASRALHLHPLRVTRGNPTRLDGPSLVEAILKAPESPVVVMVDDQGDAGTGPGEAALKELLVSPRVHVLGVVAVAAQTPRVLGVRPDFSITSDGICAKGAVDKAGKLQGSVLRGDTVDVLRPFTHDLLVVGLGDPGKMHGRDRPADGGPITLQALQAILKQAAQERRYDHGSEDKSAENDEAEHRSCPSSSSV